MDRDGRREDSGRGEGVTGAMIRARIRIDGRLAGGLQALLGAPMAAYSGCGERDDGIGHGKRRSRTGLARVCGDAGLAGGSVADGRRQAGSGMARSRARARLNCSSQGQRRGRCNVPILFSACCPNRGAPCPNACLELGRWMAPVPHGLHQDVERGYEILLHQRKVSVSHVLAVRVSVSIPDVLEIPSERKHHVSPPPQTLTAPVSGSIRLPHPAMHMCQLFHCPERRPLGRSRPPLLCRRARRGRRCRGEGPDPVGDPRSPPRAR